jgi:hypothetical protein
MTTARTGEGIEKRLVEALASARTRRVRVRRARRTAALARSRHHELELRQTG